MAEVLMPRLSDTMEEGTVARWLKQPGEPVAKGDVLAEIQTDKANMDLEAYEDGVLEQLLVEEGATVPIGEPIAVIGTGPSPADTRPAPAPTPMAQPAGPSPATAEPAGPSPATAEPAGPSPATAEPAMPQPAGRPSVTPPSAEGAHHVTPSLPRPSAATRLEGTPRSSPLARALARRHGISLADISGSGPGGRVVRADVESAIAQMGVAPATPPPAPTAATQATPGAASLGAPPTSAGDVEEVPLSAVRRLTAERLTHSAQAPHFYLTSVVDAEPLLAFRADVNKNLEAETTRITVTDLLVKACASQLRAHPQMNASWGGDKLLRHRRIHVGVAVAVPDGLVVPVIHDADRKTLLEVSAEARRLAEAARQGRLSLEQISGGTFTISNLGMYGIDQFTAIINPPQAAILAVGAATPAPVVQDGQVTAGTTMKLTLAIDHRVLDGATGAEFLADLRGALEKPLRIVI